MKIKLQFDVWPYKRKGHFDRDLSDPIINLIDIINLKILRP